jgi:hypothetical protein
MRLSAAGRTPSEAGLSRDHCNDADEVIKHRLGRWSGQGGGGQEHEGNEPGGQQQGSSAG